MDDIGGFHIGSKEREALEYGYELAHGRGWFSFAFIDDMPDEWTNLVTKGILRIMSSERQSGYVRVDFEISLAALRYLDAHEDAQ